MLVGAALAATALALLLLLAFGYFSAGEYGANASPCMRDCMNDSGGLVWCTAYCKEHGSYGPPRD